MGVSIDTGSQGGAKRPLDAELNLIPFIDLLVCCICFLLITAVWTQMAHIAVAQRQPGLPEGAVEPQPVRLSLLVGEEGYTLAWSGERLVIPRQGEVYDTERLAHELRTMRARFSGELPLTVSAEDGVRYRHLVRALDIALAGHFTRIQVGGVES